jgi:hypothetical protein
MKTYMTENYIIEVEGFPYEHEGLFFYADASCVPKGDAELRMIYLPPETPNATIADVTNHIPDWLVDDICSAIEDEVNDRWT